MASMLFPGDTFRSLHISESTGASVLSFFAKPFTNLLIYQQVKPGFTNYQPRGLVKQILEFKQNKKFKNSENFFQFKNPDLKTIIIICKKPSKRDK